MAVSKTVVKQAKEQVCSISLREFESKSQKFEYITDKAVIPAETLCDLVLFSPSSQSNMGVKISPKLEKHIDELVKEITSNLDIKNTFFYSAYESKKDRTDLKGKIKNSRKPFLCLYCPNSFLESLYASIRNALAHGNIFKKGNFFYLYSVSSKDQQLDEKDRRLTFLLKIYDIKKLSSYVNAFEKYN